MDIESTPGESIKMLSEYHSKVLQLTYVAAVALQNNLVSDKKISEQLQSALNEVRKFYGERNGR